MGGGELGRYTCKIAAESCIALDIKEVHRAGCFRPGWKGRWTWHCDGKEIGQVGCRSEEGSFILDYSTRQGREDWERVTLNISIVYTNCHFGGKRPYFICPGSHGGACCDRRVAKLFSIGKHFLCRHCSNITYASQSEPSFDRMFRRANKIRKALGGEPGMANCIATKPKGMWQKTYEKKRLEIEWCETQATRQFIKKFNIPNS